jgi:hypothetical protein
MEPTPRIRARRPRATRACDTCRAKKNKCDESYPCSYCKHRHLTCVYEGQSSGFRRFTAEYVKQLEDQVKSLSNSASGPSNAPPSVQSGHSPTVNVSQRHQHHGAAHTMTSPSVREAGEEEVSGVNRHTRGVEFYGSSSSFAMLSHIRRTGQRLRDDEDDAQLVSSLHNPNFRGTSTASHGDTIDGGFDRANNYSRCRGFAESFFSSIHYIHPILDKREFLQKCEALWSENVEDAGKHPISSFLALYYSVLALGAIVAVREGDSSDGLKNLECSRRFFDRARSCCTQLGLVTDLEMVQCFFMMV